MRLLILGGGNNQLNAIKRAVEKGHEVVLTDYYEDAPGRTYATFNEVVSTFDVEGNIEVAKKYSVDGVMTIGTDQPVYTAAKVAQSLNLPSMLDVDTAKAVTDKKVMKKIFTQNKIPTVKYKFIDGQFSEKDCEDFKFPVVLKPVDSQGQRGIYKLNTPKALKENIHRTLSYSRQNEALLEEYFENDEVTISCWVEEGIPHILTVTDRESFEKGKHIGICYAHEFPSRHIQYYKQIEKMVKDITRAFKISFGPLYIQLLVGVDGDILVNEIASRIGGAYEDLFIPYLTEVDILDMVIDTSLGIGRRLKSAVTPVPQIDKYLSVQLFFSNSGWIRKMTPLDEMKKVPGLISVGYNFKEGSEVPVIKNATARAGYMIITGRNKQELGRNINLAFEQLRVVNENGENLIIKPGDMNKL